MYLKIDHHIWKKYSENVFRFRNASKLKNFILFRKIVDFENWNLKNIQELKISKNVEKTN